MANQLFDPGREGFLDGSINWPTPTIKAALVRGYAFNAAHKFVSDIIAAGGVIAASITLAGKSVTNGVADANDITWPAVAANAANHFMLIFQASAVGGGADVAQALQRVICYDDTGANFPIVPNGGDVNIAFDNGANKIFKL